MPTDNVIEGSFNEDGSKYGSKNTKAVSQYWPNPLIFLARPSGFEPATYAFVGLDPLSKLL
jgi:hypothetical protein